MKDYELEKKNLELTILIIKEMLSKEKIDLKNLYNEFIGNREELWRIADRKQIHITNLETSLDKPYFARIDFVSNEDGKQSTIYIGKNGIIDKSNIIVTDWRAPISSLYYESEIGKCSFKAPDGIISGEMKLKRQFEIEKGSLIDYFDVDLVANDALLQKYLNSNNEARLKSIVSTIQKEQNEVIRKNLSNNLIIQGVAGSGKTTIALHRIAYLVYNYINIIKQSEYLVIGPNPVFLKYIKSVLPDLDVTGINQYTYEQFVEKYLKEEININSSEKKVIENISGKNKLDIDKFKCSIKYKKMIDLFIEIFMRNITQKSLMLDDFEVLSSTIIIEELNSIKNNHNLKLKLELASEKIASYIENNIDDILTRYNEYSFELYSQASTEEEKNKLRDKFLKDKNELRKNGKNIIKKYFSKVPMDTKKIYKLFISTIEDYNIYNYDNLSKLKKETLQNIKKSIFDFEDLAALIYIKSIINPNKEYEKTRHVVIDEAQDFGEFNFYSLKKCLPLASFSIFGDIAQSIYDYRSINNWQEVNESVFENKGEIIHLNKSYRTTSEIMEIADNVSDYIGLGKSELVVRHGEKVDFTNIETEEDISDYIFKKVIEYKNKGYKTIAIISKTDIQSVNINNNLKKLGLDIPNISNNDDISEERFRICTICNQLAKGLEFDAVIINNASEENYSSNTTLDSKLLYVAITRALHELNIVYKGNLTKSLGQNNKINPLIKIKKK